MMNQENQQLSPSWATFQRHRTIGIALRGLLVCTVGTLLYLRQQGSIPADWQVWQLWPLLLVYFGIARLFHRPGLVGALFAMGVGGVGGVLLAGNIGWVTAPVTAELWPLAVVVLGIGMVISAFTRPRWGDPWHMHKHRHWHRWHQHHHQRHQHHTIDATISDASIDRNVVMAAAAFRLDTKAFTGGTLTANLSGVQLDLRQTVMAHATAELFVNCTMSGMEIYVPEHWNVQVEISPMLGGVEVKARSNQALEGAVVPTLILRGQVTLGGIEVRN